MAARILSQFRKSYLVNSLSQTSFSSRSLSDVEHSLSSSTPSSWSSCWTKLSPSLAHSALRKEMLSSSTWGLVSRGLDGTRSLGSIGVLPCGQSSLGIFRASQCTRSFATLNENIHANTRLGFNKQRRNRGEIKGSSDNQVSFGKYGLQALEPAWITTKQIKAGELAIKRNLKGGKLFFRVFPHKPISLKPAEVRMGRGKGNVAFWVAGVKTGRILFELDGVPETVARRAITVAASKLPLKTRFVKTL